ncbi:MAG: hypothetical protein LBC56_00765 [Oscillospiraceae bacterium]|jgi:hypothetical protein|nr:hypothetical protein [Oscillospiraceae bacterium]
MKEKAAGFLSFAARFAAEFKALAKKKRLAVLAVAVLLMFSMGITYAWFTTVVTGAMTAGLADLKVTLTTDKYDPDGGEATITEPVFLEPGGYIYLKGVFQNNEASNPRAVPNAIVQIKPSALLGAVTINSDDDGEETTGTSSEISLADINIDENKPVFRVTIDWEETLKQDGYMDIPGSEYIYGVYALDDTTTAQALISVKDTPPDDVPDDENIYIDLVGRGSTCPVIFKIEMAGPDTYYAPADEKPANPVNNPDGINGDGTHELSNSNTDGVNNIFQNGELKIQVNWLAVQNVDYGDGKTSAIHDVFGVWGMELQPIFIAVEEEATEEEQEAQGFSLFGFNFGGSKKPSSHFSSIEEAMEYFKLQRNPETRTVN